jgi:tRNA-Thr(GGU) m(6)t(6)A37 methyltransferase TsaA
MPARQMAVPSIVRIAPAANMHDAGRKFTIPLQPSLRPIGRIHSPFQAPAGTPIQATLAAQTEGIVEVFPAYADGLRDLDGFDRIWLLYWFDRAPAPQLRVVPFRDDVQRGLFATRAPCRPNLIGLSCVRLIGIKGNLLTIGGVDVLDGTPLLDIKPYVPEFDAFPESRAGWLDNGTNRRTHADDRFGPNASG